MRSMTRSACCVTLPRPPPASAPRRRRRRLLAEAGCARPRGGRRPVSAGMRDRHWVRDRSRRLAADAGPPAARADGRRGGRRGGAGLLGAAERPLIVVGGGALDAGPEVQAVAEALAAPVVAFRRGRGVIPTTHPLAVSFYRGATAVEGRRLRCSRSARGCIGSRANWGVDDDAARSCGSTSTRRRSTVSGRPASRWSAMPPTCCGALLR